MKEPGSGKGEARSIITSTTGGIMTKEVGAITGDLEVVTHPTDTGGIQVSVRYAGADECYTVEGSPIEAGKVSGLAPSKLRDLHERIVDHLLTPGPVAEGNEEATSLYGFSP